MSWAAIKFDSGHELIDNGAGDYTLKCPNGEQLGFLHPGLVHAIHFRSMVCSCGMDTGRPLPGQPDPYTAVRRSRFRPHWRRHGTRRERWVYDNLRRRILALTRPKRGWASAADRLLMLARDLRGTRYESSVVALIGEARTWARARRRA